MIEVILNYQKEQICSFTVTGHAGEDPIGENIYCAGVSAITQTALLGLIKHISRDLVYEIEAGWISCELPPELDDKDKVAAQIILSTMEVGLLAMQDVYGDFLRVVIRRA